MPESQLETTARQLVAKPKGILAMDESAPSIQRRFEEVGLLASDELRRDYDKNRKAYREMLASTPGLGRYISGAILFEETLFQRTQDGTPLVDFFHANDVLPGIKVDQGLVAFQGSSVEKTTKGIEGLEERLANYRLAGARFTKFRTEYVIGKDTPSFELVHENARILAAYVKSSQAAGLVPIVEPEVLIAGDHSLGRAAGITMIVLSQVFNLLDDAGVRFNEMILKPNMVVPGTRYDKKTYSEVEVAERTVDALKATVNPRVAGIAFLSGGLSDEKATEYLNAMNGMYAGQLPWNLTFSFGRGLQREPLKIFARGILKGEEGYAARAQAELLRRAEECSLATTGSYSPKAS